MTANVEKKIPQGHVLVIKQIPVIFSGCVQGLLVVICDGLLGIVYL